MFHDSNATITSMYMKNTVNILYPTNNTIIHLKSGIHFKIFA